MEKKEKIAMEKLYVVIVIALGINCPGVIIWGQYNSDRCRLSRRIAQGAGVLGEIFNKTGHSLTDIVIAWDRFKPVLQPEYF